MGREEDFDLVRRLCSRSKEQVHEAFDELYRKYRSQIYNLSCRIMNDRDLAADVTQETFISVLRKARRFNFRSAFSSWLYRVAVNQCLDHRRKLARQRPLSLSAPEVVASADESTNRRSTPASKPAEDAELAAELGRAIASLNPRLGAAVVLRYTEGLGYEEIAEVLEVPIGTVKSRLNRAHAALEKELGPKLDRFL